MMLQRFRKWTLLITFFVFSFIVSTGNSEARQSPPLKSDTSVNAAKSKSNKLLIFFYILTGCGISFTLILIFYLQSKKNKSLLEKEKESEQILLKYLNNIAQQLKTPLTLINGPLEMLESRVSPEDKNLVQITRQNTSQLLRMIKQLQTISDNSTNSLTLRYTYFDIIELIKGIAANYTSQISEKELLLKIDSSLKRCKLYADVNYIEMVCMNLISNAIKFSYNKGIVRVEVDEVNGSKNKSIRIRISDHGRGILQEQLPHIFSRYYRIKQGGALSDEKEIGLYLSKELVQHHKGTLTVESKECEGSVFTLTLPAGRSHIPEHAILAPATTTNNSSKNLSNSKPSVKLDSKHVVNKQNNPIVLIISKNDDLRQYLRSILSKEFLVIEANKHKLAYKKTVEYTPDLIINDHGQTLNNEINLYYTIRNSVKTATTPIIALASDKSIVQTNGKLASLINSSIEKPFRAQQLITEVQKHISIEERHKLADHQSILPIQTENDNTDYTPGNKRFMSQIIQVIDANLNNEQFGVETLCSELNLSRSQLQRKIKAITNQTPNQLVRNYRLIKAHELLVNCTANISEISFQVGFTSPSYFTKCFVKKYGYTPNEILHKSQNGILTNSL